ncbi:hypothetical protein K469DRAFT_732760 [Zopfia rhizophila CBS 207.26]|uniref:Zn(2)-C6 fungal-type domain-containing protein n=1 Tax=Zopfia rhizophila CBS 207.26 TaxID=1314779 RepID=A0A6A6EKW9_9PEZI|nr:hypothetical protein K469DRAFT_732760 [Zopfia rhizophila CBS 207.26]
MRKTLRRSCDACAKSKLSCDLRTPQCSRCIKRKSACVYANQPLTSSLTGGTATSSPRTSPEVDGAAVRLSTNPMTLFNNPGIQSFDPFDSYPQTRLPRVHVQRLIQHFLSNIAFQYYPLDLNITSNPFVVSWWPLALADPALFHVSLQTASLDIELRARRGFTNSEVLMVDSVSLVRQRIEDPVLAFQDETMDSVVTLAAIEFGKGNMAVSKMHIDGVKSMVQMRGGMQQVKRTTPLTARMVSWVSLIVMQSPQFPTQKDSGVGDGIAPISQWHEAATSLRDPVPPPLDNLDLDPAIGEILFRLRNLFHEPRRFDLSNTDLHDLTCFVLHRLLLWSPQSTHRDISPAPAISECVRYAVALYMLIIHGPTYFSHARLQYNTTLQLRAHLEGSLASLLLSYGSLALWLLSVGMVASDGTPECHWFTTQAGTAISSFVSIWLKTQQAEYLFRQRWEEVWAITAA